MAKIGYARVSTVDQDFEIQQQRFYAQGRDRSVKSLARAVRAERSSQPSVSFWQFLFVPSG
ncbi:hypothetical protein E0H62_14935 [Rhizobium leguminosarum bv. viciae]|nr:hypothetical protein E0H62_14935 [Rhizobium leguminosarum bv. viciae]